MKERVGYAKGFGIFLIIGSVFILGVSLMIGFSLNSITGVLLLIMGILYLNNPVLVYDKEELEWKNLYGSTMKRYNFHSDKIEVKEGSIYVNDSKLRLGSLFLNGGEMNKLKTFIENKEYL